jgi:hypothetical protein
LTQYVANAQPVEEETVDNGLAAMRCGRRARECGGGGGGWTRDKALVPEGKAKEEEDEEGRALPQRSRVSTNTPFFYNGRDRRRDN